MELTLIKSMLGNSCLKQKLVMKAIGRGGAPNYFTVIHATTYFSMNDVGRLRRRRGLRAASFIRAGEIVLSIPTIITISVISSFQ